MHYCVDPTKHAEDIFRTVSEDANIIKEAIQSYTEAMQEELSYAVTSAQEGLCRLYYNFLYTRFYCCAYYSNHFS